MEPKEQILNQENFDIMKFLNKENEILKKFKNEKINENETLNSLLIILQLQRERISFLEEGITYELLQLLENKNLTKEKFQLEEKLRMMEFKIPSVNIIDKNFGMKVSERSNYQKKFSEYNLHVYDPMMGVKNFTNFGIQDHKSSEIEFYKKKCILLEENLKDFNKKFNNNMRITNHSLDSELNPIDFSVKYSDSRKRTLTPIIK